MAIREGRWDCVACGRTANLGRDLRCAGCGRARGKVKFYLPANEPAVLDSELLARARAGPDWSCGYCQASNRSTSQACTGCGASRSEGTSRVRGGADATEGVKPKPAWGNPALSAAISGADQERIDAMRRVAAGRQKMRTVWLWVFALCGFLGCTGITGSAGFSYRWGGTRGEGGPSMRLGAPNAGPDVELVSKVATRTIEVEAHRLVTKESWCSSKPSDARELSRSSRKSGTREVCRLDAGRGPMLGWLRVQEDLGNGFFSDSDSGSGGGGSYDWGSSGSDSSTDRCTTVDTYDDWCSWQAWRWIVERTPFNSDPVAVPAWPELGLASDERPGKKRERYEATFLTTDGETVVMKTDQAQWLAWQAGGRYRATWSFFGGLESIGGPVFETAAR